MKPLTITDPATVRGILDGTVTQYWFPLQPQPERYSANGVDMVRWEACGLYTQSPEAEFADPAAFEYVDILRVCKYKAGDRLYLRESWFPVSKNYGYKKGDQPGRMYELNGKVIQWPQVRMRWPGIWVLEDAGEYWRREWYLKEYTGKSFRWRPAHTMPEWASRCVVEVDEVRACRVQDGEPEILAACERAGLAPARILAACAGQHDQRFPKYPYATNPFMWDVKFRRVS